MYSEKNQLLLIEIVRFLAAISVLVWHYQNFTFVSFEHIDFVVSKQPFYFLLWPFYDRGLLGVQVFWAVSGFIFFWKYKAPLSENLISAKRFFILRFSRLYPLHFLTLLVVSCLQYIYNLKTSGYFAYNFYDLHHFLPHLLMASNWISSDFSFNGPIWSVSCEVLVYAFFYLTITKLNLNTKSIFIVFLACVLLSVLHLDHNVTNCLKYFLLGGLSFEAYSFVKASGVKGKLDRILISLTIICMMALFLAYQLDIVRFNHYTFVLLILIPFVLYFSPTKITNSKVISSAITGVGNLTYSSYLTHFPIQLIIVNWFAYRQIKIPFYEGWFFILYLVVVILVSYMTFHFFEKPLQKYIRDNSLGRT